MLAPSKRRRISFYSLPLVVAIGFAAGGRLAAWQRTDVIADLADRVAHGETAEATDAVHQLAAMPNPPLSILVAAATSDEHETAEAAQVAINRLLRRWQRQIEAKQRVSAVASQLARLAASAGRRAQRVSAADYPWLCEHGAKDRAACEQVSGNENAAGGHALRCDSVGRGGTRVGDHADCGRRRIDRRRIEKRRGRRRRSRANRFRAAAGTTLEREFSAFVTQPMATENEPHDRARGDDKYAIPAAHATARNQTFRRMR